MDEKIKISAPKLVYELLKKDCEDFKITKPDGSPNMNAFLNGIVSNYYEEFAGAEARVRNRSLEDRHRLVAKVVRDKELAAPVLRVVGEHLRAEVQDLRVLVVHV